MKIPIPTYDPNPEDEVLDENGLSKEMARKLHAVACQGFETDEIFSPGKLMKEVWQEAKTKLKPHNDAALPPVDAKSWHPKAFNGGAARHRYS